ncbi:MAG: hypothetical protein ACTHNU_13835, partial [Gaiellales bacterium]
RPHNGSYDGAVGPLDRFLPWLPALIGAAAVCAMGAWATTAPGVQTPAGGAGAVLAVGFGLFLFMPFAALVAASRRLGVWATVGLGVAFVVFEVSTFQDAMRSSSAVAPVLVFSLPVAMLLVVPLCVAMADALRLVGRHRRGGALPAAGWPDVAVALVLGAAGFMLLAYAGAAAGLALGFARWAGRRPAQQMERPDPGSDPGLEM